jgi:hypothetical protein
VHNLLGRKLVKKASGAFRRWRLFVKRVCYLSKTLNASTLQCIIELSSLEVSVRQAGAPGCLIHTKFDIHYSLPTAKNEQR